MSAITNNPEGLTPRGVELTAAGLFAIGFLEWDSVERVLELCRDNRWNFDDAECLVLWLGLIQPIRDLALANRAADGTLPTGPLYEINSAFIQRMKGVISRESKS